MLPRGLAAAVVAQIIVRSEDPRGPEFPGVVTGVIIGTVLITSLMTSFVKTRSAKPERMETPAATAV
jgi:hypothetical protein